MNKNICPMLSGINLEGELIKVSCLENECRKYVNVVGTNPQTGETVNQWDCSDAWLPVLMVENSQQQRGTSAAVESLRNEVFRTTNAVRMIDNRKQIR